MNKNIFHNVSVLVLLTLLFLICCIVLLSATQFWLITPERDSGVFMHVGSQILEGKIPYRDVWDHKPPLIFYINALGLFIDSDHWWGVWLMQVIFLYLTVMCAFLLLRDQFGWIPATVSCGVFLVLFQQLYENGNYTEQYALLWQFLALYLFVDLKRNPQRWHGYLIGLTGAMAFLLRQNLIGVWIAIGLFYIIDALFSRDWRMITRVLGQIIVGGSLPLLLVALYFAVQGAFTEMMNAVFVYNFAHVASGQSTDTAGWINAWLYGFREISFADTGIRPFLLLPVTYGVIAVYLRWASEKVRPLIILTLYLLPIEIILANLSGYGFPHYYLTWLPVFMLQIAITIFILARLCLVIVQRFVSPDSRILRYVVGGMRIGIPSVTIGLLFLYFYPNIPTYLERRDAFPDEVLSQVPTFTAEYVRLHTNPEDYIFVWGAQAEVYTMSERSSPTRFIYLYPMTKLGYNLTATTREVYQDILDNPPALIIDTRSWSLPPLDINLASAWQPRPGHGWHDDLNRILNHVDANYELEFVVANAWYIYRMKPPNAERVSP